MGPWARDPGPGPNMGACYVNMYAYLCIFVCIYVYVYVIWGDMIMDRFTAFGNPDWPLFEPCQAISTLESTAKP